MFSLMGNDQMSQTGPAVMDQPYDVTYLHADPSEGGQQKLWGPPAPEGVSGGRNSACDDSKESL